MTATNTLHIPLVATYRIVNGEPVQIAAEYGEVPADTMARLLIKGFGLPILEKEERNHG